jgi:group I intron endonuclease
MEYYNYNHISNGKRKFTIYIALLKFAYSGFKLEIFEYCDIFNLIVREAFYIYNLTPHYNILNHADSSLGFKHSEASKELFRSYRLEIKRGKLLKDFSAKQKTCSSLDNSRLVSDKTRLNLSNNSYKAIPVILTHVVTGLSTT